MFDKAGAPLTKRHRKEENRRLSKHKSKPSQRPTTRPTKSARQPTLARPQQAVPALQPQQGQPLTDSALPSALPSPEVIRANTAPVQPSLIRPKLPRPNPRPMRRAPSQPRSSRAAAAPVSAHQEALIHFPCNLVHGTKRTVRMACMSRQPIHPDSRQHGLTSYDSRGSTGQTVLYSPKPGPQHEPKFHGTLYSAYVSQLRASLPPAASATLPANPCSDPLRPIPSIFIHPSICPSSKLPHKTTSPSLQFLPLLPPKAKEGGRRAKKT